MSSVSGCVLTWENSSNAAQYAREADEFIASKWDVPGGLLPWLHSCVEGDFDEAAARERMRDLYAQHLFDKRELGKPGWMRYPWNQLRDELQGR